jgi:hypothetical protein
MARERVAESRATAFPWPAPLALANRLSVCRLELADEETFALLNLLVETIEADKFPLSPRVQILRAILAKFGPMAAAPPPPARPPTPEERDPGRAPRYRPRRAR